MIKVRIYIKSDYSLYEEGVFISVLLPHIPSKGNVIYLDNKQTSELELKAKKNLDTANKFAPTWFYNGSSNIKYGDVKKNNIKDLSFDDAVWVYNVVYKPNSKIIRIIINNDPNEE
jgi:hypothetical protein